MALVALDGTPLVLIGAIRGYSVDLPAVSNATQDAANEACIMIGQMFWADGGTHTVDTTGSSSLGWRSGAITFADVGTTFKVGLAPVDTATGPPGRATNVANVISFDVSKTYTSAAPVSADSWIESVPGSGTKTIAHGDAFAFCTQMTARGGVDSIVTTCSTISQASFPLVTQFTGSYVGFNAVPNAIITASDGTLGWFWGGIPFNVSPTTQTWNSSSGTKEYGNYFLLPFPMKIYGLASGISVGGDCDLVLYSDPLGTPVAEKTKSTDRNTVSAVGSGTSRFNAALFTSPYSASASQPLAAIAKPTSATNTDLSYFSLNASLHQAAYPCGTNSYAVSRNTGAFTAQNSSKDRYAIGLLVGAFDAGGPAGRSVQINNDSLVA